MRKTFQTCRKSVGSVWGWLGKNESPIVALAAIAMIWTLIQNQKALKQNAQTLQTSVEALELQRISTLQPELECAYNPYEDEFLVRNVGTVAAENIFFHTDVYSVTSNEVIQLIQIRGHGGTILPPLEKPILLAGETARADKVYVPDTQWMAAFWEKYRGELLVRVFVSYERAQPLRRYSGCFDFTMNSSPEIAPHLITPFRKLLTIEEKPQLQETLQKFSAMPRERFRSVTLFGGTNAYEFPNGLSDNGVGSTFGRTSNGVFFMGSWAKHH